MRKISLSLILIPIIFLSGLLPIQPVRAAGASLYLAPGSGTYVIGGKFSVAVKVNTGGAVINAAEGTISFDKNLLEVAGVSKGGSVFSLWTTEPTFSNTAGTISFGGGVPRPGYNGAAGGVCTITFKAKKAGAAQVRFTAGAVLANDGKGTNILASMGSGSYTVSPQVTPPETSKPETERPKPTETVPETPKETDYNKPDITSPTHADQNRWYNVTTAKFEWPLPDNITQVSVSLNNLPVSDPGNKLDGRLANKEISDIAHGVSYLHVKFFDNKKWGTIAHYRIMVDTKPPKPFEAVIKEIGVGEWPEILFETADEDSGLEKYEIFIGSLEKQAFETAPDKKSVRLENLSVGEHLAMVRALDKAGNYQVAAIDFMIAPIPAPIITNYTEEIRPSGEFFISGTAIENTSVEVFIQKDNDIIKGTAQSDPNGSWFYAYDKGLGKGRHMAWAEAINKNGLRSEPSSKASFLVSPPVFTTIGNFVLNYFVVFVSLVFMIVVIIALIFLIVFFVRRKLKKETVEAEVVLHNNLKDLRKMIEEELTALEKHKGKAGFKEEEIKTEKKIEDRIAQIEKKILKEMKDVEDILK